MIYIGKEERIFPRYGVFKPGVEVDFDENLLNTGLFREKNSRKDGKEGEE